MQDINFKITDEDLQKYLEKHKDEYEYKEAMLVKYLRENKEKITKEALEILLYKYDNDEISTTGVYDYNSNPVIERSLPNFNKYLSSINNIDISGICHILIPTLGCFDKYHLNYEFLSTKKFELNDLSKVLIASSPYVDFMTLKSAAEDYCITSKICANICDNHTMFIKFNISKEECAKELDTYKEIYGENNVKIISKHVEERMM